ncbi:response regulator transcription factor [Winogradskyella sp. A3E31]|uniref:response regulator transcription factor n=1 Tax=Winogradskyella sp. A3E31 TaxID=3349637 RepID=UPI00398B5A2C
MILLGFLCVANFCSAQFSFSGQINPEEWQSTVYLSIVEDFRKLNGVYTEQIIAKTTADEAGYFEFKGNFLNPDNRIYRIHIDNCDVFQQDINHFNGHCPDSRELLFIANNQDTLKLPYSFDKQIFCNIDSTNPNANALVKIDSLKADMRFAYGDLRTEANRKLNNKKWFNTLQNFGDSLNEPLANLYVYSFLSDRSNEFHSYYVEDLKDNDYYQNLETNLNSKYPNTAYTLQYNNELAADTYMISTTEEPESKFKYYALIALLVFSLGLNIWVAVKYYTNKKQKKAHLKEQLSKQEQVVLDHLLEDKSNKDIAEALFLSVSTVKSHTNNIYKKLNVQSRDEAKSLFVK